MTGFPNTFEAHNRNLSSVDSPMCRGCADSVATDAASAAISSGLKRLIPAARPDDRIGRTVQLVLRLSWVVQVEDAGPQSLPAGIIAAFAQLHRLRSGRRQLQLPSDVRLMNH